MEKENILIMLKDIKKELFISKEAGLEKIKSYKNCIEKNKKIDE